jgi:hypothetical protein
MVQAGLMPKPIELFGKRRAWDIRELDRAIDELPRADHPAQINGSVDPYDDVHA